MSRYSHSQIHSYLTCPLQYRYKKVDNLPHDPEESLHLLLGTAVHCALEKLYTSVGNRQTLSLEGTQEVFVQTRQEGLRNFKNPVQEIDSAPFVERGLAYVTWYYETYAPFASTSITEENISIQLASDVFFGWKIDRMDVRGPLVTIVDYKTSRHLQPDTQDKDRQQLVLYAIGVQLAQGKKFEKIVAKLIYLHLEKEYEREVSVEEMKQVRGYYLAIAEEIDRKKEAYLEDGDEHAFVYKTGYQCETCPFKSICPARKHDYMPDESVTIGDLSESTIKREIDHYSSILAEINALKVQQGMIKEFLLKYAREKGITKLFGQQGALSLMSRDMLDVDVAQPSLVQVLGEHGLLDEVRKIDKNALAKAVKSGKVSLEELGASRHHSEYFTSVRKKGEAEED